MNMGTTIFSGYFDLRMQLTTVPLGAGKPAALSVTFHPSTKSLISSASFRNLRVGTNSFKIFKCHRLGLTEDKVRLKRLLGKQKLTAADLLACAKLDARQMQ